MPFIDSKVSVKLSDEQRETLKSRLGKAIGILGKPESYLMVGLEDDYDLYFGGNKLEKGAYVSVSLLGDTKPAACGKMTEEICNIYDELFGIPGSNIYVTYHGVHDWGWDGRNF